MEPWRNAQLNHNSIDAISIFCCGWLCHYQQLHEEEMPCPICASEKKLVPWVPRGLILNYVLGAQSVGRAIKINYFDRLMITTVQLSFHNDFWCISPQTIHALTESKKFKRLVFFVKYASSIHKNGYFHIS